MRSSCPAILIPGKTSSFLLFLFLWYLCPAHSLYITYCPSCYKLGPWTVKTIFKKKFIFSLLNFLDFTSVLRIRFICMFPPYLWFPLSVCLPVFVTSSYISRLILEKFFFKDFTTTANILDFLHILLNSFFDSFQLWTSVFSLRLPPLSFFMTQSSLWISQSNFLYIQENRQQQRWRKQLPTYEVFPLSESPALLLITLVTWW